MDGTPPCTVQELESLDLGKYAGDALDAAMGRLHLLEGNARQAAEILHSLADKRPDQPEWNYYASWASALTGDGEGIVRCLNAVGDGRAGGQWRASCWMRILP